MIKIVETRSVLFVICHLLWLVDEKVSFFPQVQEYLELTGFILHMSELKLLTFKYFLYANKNEGFAFLL